MENSSPPHFGSKAAELVVCCYCCGCYSSISWPNTLFYFEGRGVGGSGVMNGGLAMIPSPEDFDSWPIGWRYKQMAPLYRKIFSKLSVTSTPSADGLLYTQEAANYFDNLATKWLGLKKADLNSNPGARANTFSLPEVTAEEGKRMDACQVSSYIGNCWLLMDPSFEVEPHFIDRTHGQEGLSFVSPSER